LRRRDRRELAAIMFTDLVGYSTLVQRNEKRALELLDQHRKLIRSSLRKYDGKEVKTMGDGFLIEFPSALQAARCAVDIQSAFAKRNAGVSEGQRFLVRIGLHLGDVIRQGRDIVGDGVNIASRIEPFAQPGGICITQQVFDQIQNKLDSGITELGPQHLKHIESPITLFRIELGFRETGIPRLQSTLDKHRLAVLPLANFSPDSADAYFSDGMTEELISTLSRINGLGVIARTSVMKYKGGTKTVADIGRELGVGSVLEGSVRKAGSKVRITVQLVDALREEPLWSQEYDRDLSDVFAIQSDVAGQVAGSLRVKFLQPAGNGRDGRATGDTGAYTFYLKGRYFWNGRTEESLKKAIVSFRQALRRDPTYALAYSGLADSYASLSLLELVPPREAFPRAKGAALRALKIDHGLAEAHTSLGLTRFQYDRDWVGSESEFRKAIEINPGYAPAHHFFADYLKAMGRFDEALTEIRQALVLDPLSLPVNTGLGHVLYLSRDYDGAIEQYQKTVELDPNYVQTHLWFGRPYLQKGMYKEAISEIMKAVDISKESTISMAVLGHAYAASGKSKDALKIANMLKSRATKQYVPSYWIALIYVGLQDKEEAFTWLSRAFKERSSWLAWIKVEPRFDVLRGDKKFSNLLSKMNLQ
jgi:TolB-like protein/Tfp pilus assembly protein PilF